MVSWRKPGKQSVYAIPTTFRGFLFITLAGCMSLPLSAADGIATVQENGRTVYVNSDEVRPVSRTAARTVHSSAARYKYWSSVERRWVYVPRPTQAALTAARSAAADVATYVSAQPAGSGISASVNPGYRRIAKGHHVSPEEIDRAIDEAAQKHNVDPNLVRAVVKVESNFNSQAVSRKGAMGLMQLMPSTARTLHVTNPFDPKQNVDAGVRHLKGLLDSYNGDVRLSLAAYNAGQGAVARNNGIPPYAETQNYVKRITELYWNGVAPGTRLFTSSAAPIHIFRNQNGVLRITNTE